MSEPQIVDLDNIMSHHSPLLEIPTSNIVWSVSKSDTANQCLYKYKKVYIDKISESSPALILGDRTHLFIAKELTELMRRDPSIAAMQKKLDEENALPEIYAMLPHIQEFLVRWKKYCLDNPLEYFVENKYAITKDDKQAESFFTDDAYIRGVIDLWALDANNKRLIVIDHKTSKKAPSEEEVRNNKQLNLYCWKLTKMFNLKWDRAVIMINAVRHGKLIQVGKTYDDIMTFGEQFKHLLSMLEEKIAICTHHNYWPARKSYTCNWCSFKSECPAWKEEGGDRTTQ